MLIKLLHQHNWMVGVFYLSCHFWNGWYKYGSEGRHWQNNPIHPVWSAEPLIPGACMCISHLIECTVNLIVAGSIGSPAVTLCVINIYASPMCTDAVVFLCWKLYNVLHCFSTLVTSLPLEVWNTGKSSLRRDFYLCKTIFF